MRRLARLTALALLVAPAPAGAQPTGPVPEPALLTRVECRGLEGPCEYRYGIVNPAGAPERPNAFALLESGEATVRSSAGWSVRQEGGVIRWETGSDGVSAGWIVGGFVLSAPGLPRLSLAEVTAGSTVRSVPALVPGPPPETLGSARDLVDGLLHQVPSLAGMGWIASGPGRGLLADRLRAVIDLLDRDQRTEALRRMQSLADEVGRLSPVATVPAGRTPGAGRPWLTSGTPLAPEVRDLFVATLGLARARMGALR